MKLILPKQFIVAALGLVAIIVMIAVAVFFRVVVLGDNPVATFWEIMVWQAASWLPWGFVLALIALPFGTKLQDKIKRWNMATHVIGAFIVATASTLWFKLVSENISPFLDMEGTRYGVFPWFFIFWFFFGLFFYWGAVSTFGLAGQGASLSSKKPSQVRLVVKTGKVSEVTK